MECLGTAAHRDPVVPDIHLGYIQRLSSRNPQALALAYRIKRDSPVLSDEATLPIYHRAGLDGFARKTLQKRTVIIIWQKTDFLTVIFVRHRQAELPGQTAHLIFGVASYGKQDMPELLLAEPIQKIRLIFQGIPALDQLDPLACVDQPGIMARGQIIGVTNKCLLEQRVKFDKLIAAHTRIRSPAQQVLTAEISNHPLP